MIIGIDATNLRAGGGITHLCELLSHTEIELTGFDRIIVWAKRKTIEKLPELSWLEKRTGRFVNGSLIQRTFWQQTVLPRELKETGCSVLFSPGGTLPFRVSVPTVTMSQNMLPFEKKERQRFKKGFLRYKLWLLKYVQSRSFLNADGVIFLSQYAERYVQKSLGQKIERASIIAHGVSSRFKMFPRQARAWESFSWEKPLHVLCVSIIDVYKHQWKLVEAVAALRKEGFPAVVDFIGPTNPEAMPRFQAALEKHDPAGEFALYHGPVDFYELEQHYQGADMFAFTSSCENLPNILLEAMAAGLPIVCSEKGPMPEVLGDCGEYFDPESAQEIQVALRKLIVDSELRQRHAQEAYARASEYSWTKCANSTFDFLSEVVKTAD